MKKLRAIAIEDPKSFRFILKIAPIEKVVPSNINEIAKWVKKKKDAILENQTFRITVEKRMTNLNRDELIKIIAELIDRKVDLKNPDKILMIQILGENTGLSIINPEDIISIPKIITKSKE